MALAQHMSWFLLESYGEGMSDEMVFAQEKDRKMSPVGMWGRRRLQRWDGECRGLGGNG